MILCVSPNPAVDRTYAVPGYGAGGVFRPADYVAAAGGKGINVARAVHNLGDIFGVVHGSETYSTTVIVSGIT